jgi:hypothetical protein
MPWRKRKCLKQSSELGKQWSHGHSLDTLIFPHFTNTQLTLLTTIMTHTKMKLPRAYILSSIPLLFIQSPWHPMRPLLHSSAMTIRMLAPSCEHVNLNPLSYLIRCVKVLLRLIKRKERFFFKKKIWF